MYFKENRIFGPKVSSFSSDTPYQTGFGLGSLLSSFGRKLLPFAKKIGGKVGGVAKKVLGSKVVKDTAKDLLSSGIEASGEILSEAILGGDVKKKSKEKLDEARQQIAETIRAGTKRKSNPTEKKRTKKRKKVLLVARKSVRPKKTYSVFDEDDSE